MALKIEDYALIGDLQTAALVGRDGSIDWMCLPSFDSPACFAGLLGNEENGHWRLAPASGGMATTRRYRDRTLVLEQEWTTDTGVVRVIDFMPPRNEAPDVVRIVEGVSGEVAMHSELRLRFDYGHVVPWVRRIGGQIAAVAGPDAAWLRTPVHMVGRDFATHGDFTVRAGESVPFVLCWTPSHDREPDRIDAADALEGTTSFWREWLDHSTYRGRWQGAVEQSLLALKALTYKPTGGLVAAPTTSLPELVGGMRNWDYRFCWLRDAALSLRAMIGCGYVDEAVAWRNWLLRAVAGDPAELQTVYSIHGARRLPEMDLPWLAGYEDSTPVRIGNAAELQFQLDVWGEVLDCLHVTRAAGLHAPHAAWPLQRALADYVCTVWTQPDRGLWEMRGEMRHFVHSKALAWVALDRVVQAVDQWGGTAQMPGDVEHWRSVRDEIHAQICAQGFDAERNTFVQSYGSDELDASLLQLPIMGFLPWDDPRIVGTVDAIAAELDGDGFVRRYRPGEDAADDGLPGEEGAFIACSFWLVEALVGIGRAEQATEMFERLLLICTDLGLLAEEFDPREQRLLGNFPQAFSHLALINAALALDDQRPAGLSTPPPGHDDASTIVGGVSGDDQDG